MKRMIAGLAATSLLVGAVTCNAATWVKNSFDVPNKNVEGNYYDSSSVKVTKNHVTKAIHWTEKFAMTPFGSEAYSKHLKQFPACGKSIEEKGAVGYHQMDFEISKGKWRIVAKRNYTADHKLLCTDKDMGQELDKKWHDIQYRSPMYERYYMLVTKHKLGEI